MTIPVPALQLNFARTKQLDRRITFTRPTGGWRFTEAGLVAPVSANEAIFDHDLVTAKSLGLAIYEQFTEYARLNRDLTAAARWSASNITASRCVGLDGVTNSGSTLTATGGAGTIVQTIVGSTASTSRVTGCYAKRRTGSGAVYMTQNGGTTWTDVTASLVTGAWRMLSVPAATLASPAIGFMMAASGDAIDVDFVGHRAAMVFHQRPVECATDADVTRSADLASMTGANFSSWYNQTEGTIVASFAPSASWSSSYVFDANDGTYNESISLQLGASKYAPTIVNGGATQAQMLIGAVTANSATVALAYKSNDFSSSVNGSASGTDTSGTVPAVGNLVIGARRVDGSNKINGCISRLSYFNSRLPNSVIQMLSRG